MSRAETGTRALTSADSVRVWLSLDEDHFLSATGLHERLAAAQRERLSVAEVDRLLTRFEQGQFVETPSTYRGYDSVAQIYDARPTYGPSVLNMLLKHTAPAHRLRILEIGCGTGALLEQLAPHAQEWLGAIEPSHHMLQRARRRLETLHPALELHRGSAELLPFSSESVSLIVIAQALHWFDAQEFWPEAARVLSDDHRVIAFWRIPDTTADNPVARYFRKTWPSQGPNLDLPRYFGSICRSIPPGFGLLHFERARDSMVLDSPKQALEMLKAWGMPGVNPEPAVVEAAFQQVGGSSADGPMPIPCQLIFMVLERQLESDLARCLTRSPAPLISD